MSAHHLNSNPPTPLDRWSESIQSTLAGLTHFNSTLVSDETSSTQDAAATSALGCVVTTGRQIAGRGRLGNLWADTGDQGLAATFVVKSQTPDRLAMAAAVATASTLRAMVSHDVAARIGVKWPNDIVVARAGADALLRRPQAGEVGLLVGLLVEGDEEGVPVIRNLTRNSRPDRFTGLRSNQATRN